MNRAVIPLAAAATFAAVYQLTPAPAPAPQAVEPVAVAEAVPEPAPVEAARPAAAAVKRKPARRLASPRRRAAVRPAPYVRYSGCNEVRAAGLAPLYRGQPGYREDMDGDLDGIACEPHRGRG
jgi:hypothetical protein